MANFTTPPAADFIGADALQYFVSPLFLGDNGLSRMDVMTDIKGNTYLDHFSAAQNLTKARSASSFSGTAGTVYSNPQIVPERLEVEIAMDSQNFYNRVKGQVLQSGTSKDNVDGTLLKKIGSEILMQGISADFNRQLWFADKEITKSVSTATINNAENYQVYEGIFASLASKLDSAQKLTTAYHATNNKVEDILEAMYVAATPELKALPKAFYVSGEMGDAYLNYLVSKGVAPAYMDLQNGISALSYKGIPLVVRRDWDSALANEAGAIDTTSGSEVDAGIVGAIATRYMWRAALIADKAIVVGTDFGAANVETWYNQDEKELRFRLAYVCGTVLLDKKLAVSYISA